MTEKTHSSVASRHQKRMFRMIVEAKKAVCGKLHSERRAETFTPISRKQQRVARVVAHFASPLQYAC